MAIRSQGNPSIKYASVWSKTGKGAVGAYVQGVQATGGTTYTPGNGYKYHVFNFPNSDNFVVTVSGEVEILMVGGGGGNGAPAPEGADFNGYIGGGGAGGVVHHPGVQLPAATYPVGVGEGAQTGNVEGGNTTLGGHPLGTITALGGGHGAYFDSTRPASNGGSGGGAEGTETNPAGSGTQPTQNPNWTPGGLLNYGNDGGAGTTGGAYSSAGGGGAGGAAPPAGPGPGSGGMGGPGQPFSGFEYPIVGLTPITPKAFSPTNNHYGGGGGGWGYSAQPGRPVGGGGLGGKQGDGPSPALAGDPAATSTKGLDGLGGGAGSSYWTPNASTQGGDGIVIIRYPL